MLKFMLYLIYIPKYLYFREAFPNGENFDEVRTATEGSPLGRPKGVPATERSTFRYGCVATGKS